MQSPAITLLATTYNRPNALRALLQSVLRQTVLPNEVIIADDGSTDETRRLIEQFQTHFPIPIVHVWHPDTGFRKCEILNRAIAEATGDYIIQIDGDIVMERHFLADHMESAEVGWFVCGSRVLLSEEQTRQVENDPEGKPPRLWRCRSASWPNGLRCKALRLYLAKRYARGKIKPLRGCNMAFWKNDLLAVNGYNEELTNWGAEDLELGYRLLRSGIRKQMLKMGGVQYHLYHPQAARDALEQHKAVIRQMNENGQTRCTNGIDKHLTH
ncbi:MAG: glycosyltransferase family 2 protein [Rikenella sp.]|nr:glycosyltransferase family 2 protein [Rikenella sp.]